MSLGSYDVLLELSVAPHRRLRMQELGERSVLSLSRVSRIVDDLTAQGLVSREPCPDDRRATFAALSDAGRSALRRADPPTCGALSGTSSPGSTQASSPPFARRVSHCWRKTPEGLRRTNNGERLSPMSAARFLLVAIT